MTHDDQEIRYGQHGQYDAATGVVLVAAVAAGAPPALIEKVG